MKKVVSVTEVEGEGFLALLGKKVILFCANYFYAGVLEGVNDECVMLRDAHIVFETGNFTDKQWKDAARVGDILYVMKQAVESFGEGK